MGKHREKISILVALIVSYLFIKLSILFFGFNKIHGYGFQELQFGACARELIRSFNSPFSCYGYIGSGLSRLTNSCAAALLNDILAVPLFMLFGESYLTLKLIPLFFNLAILISLFLFLYKFFSKKVAVITGILLVVPPSIFTNLSFACNANKCEFILFTILSMHIFYGIIFDKKEHPVNFILFGFISAVGLCLNYIFLITLAACFLVWFISDARFFLRKKFWVFMGIFTACLLPWVYYVVRNIGGVYIYSKPVYSHFLTNGVVNSFIRFRELVSSQLFNLFILEDIGLIKGYFSGGIFYLVFILSFCVFSWINMRYILQYLTGVLRRKEADAVSSAMPKEFFIFIYLLVFFMSYSFSDFALPGTYDRFNFVNYRYLASIYPFLLIIIALFFERLGFKRHMRFVSNTILTMLIAIGLLSNLAFISFGKFGEGLQYEGFGYTDLGCRFALRFGDKIDTAIKFMDRVDSGNEGLMYAGFATGLACYDFSYNNVTRIIDMVDRRVDKKHHAACYEGLGIGFAQILWNGRAQEGLDLIRQLDHRYRGYFYRGMGMEICSRNIFGLDAQEGYFDRTVGGNIEKAYRHFCYEGFGVNLGFNLGYSISDCIDSINRLDPEYRRYCYYGLGEGFGRRANYHNIPGYVAKIKHMEKDYRAYCYQGLGEGVVFRYGEDIGMCIKMIEKIEKEYRPYGYYGAGIGIGVKFGYDVNECRKILMRVDKEYRNNFLKGLEEGAGRLWGEQLFSINSTIRGQFA
jgi:hypothetical protein